MDTFIEKIITKKKDIVDIIFITAVLSAGLIIFFITASIDFLRVYSFILIAGEVFGMYYLIRSRNIEFEYTFSGGDLKIVKIIAKSRRKKIFEANCKDFIIIARPDDPRVNNEAGGIVKKIDFTGAVSNPDVFFAVINYSGQKTGLFLELNQNLLKAMKMYIPSKLIE